MHHKDQNPKQSQKDSKEKQARPEKGPTECITSGRRKRRAWRTRRGHVDNKRGAAEPRNRGRETRQRAETSRNRPDNQVQTRNKRRQRKGSTREGPRWCTRSGVLKSPLGVLMPWASVRLCTMYASFTLHRHVVLLTVQWIAPARAWLHARPAVHRGKTIQGDVRKTVLLVVSGKTTSVCFSRDNCVCRSIPISRSKFIVGSFFR